METSASGSTRTSLDYLVNIGESIESRYREPLGALLNYGATCMIFSETGMRVGGKVLKYQSRVYFSCLSVWTEEDEIDDHPYMSRS